MFGLISKRLLNGFVVLISVIILVSTIIFASPVDPIRLTFGQRLDEKTLELKKKELGLDLPLHKQIITYVSDISPVVISQRAFENFYIRVPLLFKYKLFVKPINLRYSYQSGKSVKILIGNALPNTILLALTAFLLACVLGISLGVLAAINHNSAWDRTTVFISTIGISLPSYVTAMILALFFAKILGSYTGLNLQGSVFTIDDLGNDIIQWKNLILPAIALGIRPISIITQITRSVVIDILSSNYIKTAQSKGLSFGKVVKRHVLRNAGNPILTTVSGWFASLLAGSFFVEYVFNFKGVGLLTINSLLMYDVPLLLGCLIFICSLFIIVNILVDILYKWLDPKIVY